MRRIIVCLTFAVILAASCSVPAYSASSWNVADEIARLGREAPPLSAFPGTPGVVWMSSDRYSLTSEGGKEHYGIYLILLGEEAEGNAITSRRFPYPAEEGATLEITEAAWYDTNGARLGDLPTRKYDINGVGGIEVEFPDEAYGLVAAIAFHENVPGRYYLDDALSLAGELPIWEQIVTVEVPDGMTVYWDGVGVMNPERVRNGRTELMTWTVLNEPAWRGTGMTDSGKPSLSFSLEHGYIAMLKNMKELEKAPYSPPIPSSVSLYRSNVFKAAGSVAKYMASRSIASERGTDIVRHFENISSDGPWTGWEQVMIASKWMASLGFTTQIYCAPSIPAGSDGPASPKIWREPILRISDVGGR
ncbi:MAG: hypothetical protein LBT23_01560, partial [Synergistaceae bacterium]|nr:hypothetical protein [Synergistaceae bacterium]